MTISIASITFDGAEVAGWIDAGASSLGKRKAGDFVWVTLSDPDGNEFCISGG